MKTLLTKDIFRLNEPEDLTPDICTDGVFPIKSINCRNSLASEILPQLLPLKDERKVQLQFLNNHNLLGTPEKLIGIIKNFCKEEEELKKLGTFYAAKDEKTIKFVPKRLVLDTETLNKLIQLKRMFKFIEITQSANSIRKSQRNARKAQVNTLRILITRQ